MYEHITVEQAADLLARRYEASVAVGGLTKLADWQSTVFGPDAATGTLRNALLGAGLGGLGGAAANAMTTRDPEDEDQPSVLQSALRGAVAGGAAGGLPTLGYHGLAALAAPAAPPAKSGDGNVLGAALGGLGGWLGGNWLGQAGQARSLGAAGIENQLTAMRPATGSADPAVALAARADIKRTAGRIAGAGWAQRLRDALAGNAAGLARHEGRALARAAGKWSKPGIGFGLLGTILGWNKDTNEL